MTDTDELRKLAEARRVMDEQANDDGIWFIAETAAEAYLQQELRRLHEAVEGKTSEECANDFLKVTSHDG